MGSNSTGCWRGCLAVPREVAPSHRLRPITSELQIFFFPAVFEHARAWKYFTSLIKTSWQSYQFKMMKSLTSLPPSSASAARPSPWSYSPKQILFFLKFDCESLEGIKASSPSSSGPPAASCASSGRGGEACPRASSPSCWLLSPGSDGSLAPVKQVGLELICLDNAH